jgi:hypothetical protein
MRTPTRRTSIIAPTAALWYQRAHAVAQHAYAHDSKRAAVLALELRQLADVLAAAERAS